MRDKLSDKLPILVRLILQCKLCFLVLLVLALAACATGTDRPGPDERDPASSTADVTSQREALDSPASELDSELLFHVLAAERLGAVGDFEDALGHYLEAARLGDDPELARQAVRVAMRLQDWDAMMEAAAIWQAMAPDDSAPEQFRLLGLINAGATDQAAAGFSERIEQADDASAAWREVIVLIGAAEDQERALAVMDALVEHLDEDGVDPEVLENRSFLYWQLGQGERALELALQAAEYGGERDQLVWAAQLAAAEDDPELALSLYQRARAVSPDEHALALAEAEILRQMDRTDDAVDLLKALPPNSEVLYTLGTYLFQAERDDEAAEVWQQLAAIEDADDAVHHAFLVAFLAELLEFDEPALAWYEQVQSGPNVNRAILRRAIIVGRQGELSTARQLLQSLRQGDDADLREQSWLVEADLLREADQAEKAIELLSGALRERPTSASLLYARAICAVAADNLELAEQDFRRILQLEDDNAMALNALGYTLTDRTNRHQEAYRLIRRALELEPDEPAILDSMGWVYFRLGQPETALPYLERALDGEDNPEIAAHLGEVLLVLGREEEAMAIFDDYRQRYPDDRYLQDTLERLGL